MKMAERLKLTRCKINESVVIDEISGVDESVRGKLTALGLTEGRRVRLLQKRLAHVIACDFTQIAVDREIAARIVVRRDG